jgi:hypothetical protein
MRLTYRPFNGRGRYFANVIDQDSGKIVGQVNSAGVRRGYHLGGMTVSLFNGRYQSRFNNSHECWGFIRGVECALNHVDSALGINIEETSESAAA